MLHIKPEFPSLVCSWFALFLRLESTSRPPRIMIQTLEQALHTRWLHLHLIGTVHRIHVDYDITKASLFCLRFASLSLRCRLLETQATTPRPMTENAPTTTPRAIDAFLLRPLCPGETGAGSSPPCCGPVSTLILLEWFKPRALEMKILRGGSVTLENLHLRVKKHQSAALDERRRTTTWPQQNGHSSCQPVTT
ncbi:hypothetical protein GE09DRAFT_525321 [Coniochaeta sp. 2T2.1]|nr:hypothetical protein GE09DRAFT_525321 [Coniochaeta sp. 2T2.1]